MSEDNSVAVTVTETEARGARVPATGVIASHEPPTLVAFAAFHVKGPPPLLVMVIVCGVGLDCPTTALNESVTGVVVRPGAAGDPRVSVTGRVCVLDVALKMIAPVYVPGVRPATVTPTSGWAGVTPLVLPLLLTLSQLPPLFVVTFALQCMCVEHPSATPTLITCAAGAGCAYALAKVRLPGDTWST